MEVHSTFADGSANRPQREADLAAIEDEISKLTTQLNRYLDAFENETMPPEVCGPRLEELGQTMNGLQARREELSEVEDDLEAPSVEELEKMAAMVEEQPKPSIAIVLAAVRCRGFLSSDLPRKSPVEAPSAPPKSSDSHEDPPVWGRKASECEADNHKS